MYSKSTWLPNSQFASICRLLVVTCLHGMWFGWCTVLFNYSNRFQPISVTAVSNNHRLKDAQNPFRWLIGYVFSCCSSAPCLRIGCHMKKLLSGWLFAPAICASASCNWCYLGSCLVDFHSDFCISTCHKPPMVDGIDWQQSRGLFSEALDAWPNLPLASAERRQLQTFFFESIEPLMQQVGVLLVFAYVCIIFNLGDFFDC